MPQANCSPAVLACVGVDRGQLLLAALNWAARLLVHPCVVAGVTACLLMPVKHHIGVICGFELHTLQKPRTAAGVVTVQRSCQHAGCRMQECLFLHCKRAGTGQLLFKASTTTHAKATSRDVAGTAGPSSNHVCHPRFARSTRHNWLVETTCRQSLPISTPLQCLLLCVTHTWITAGQQALQGGWRGVHRLPVGRCNQPVCLVHAERQRATWMAQTVR